MIGVEISGSIHISDTQVLGGTWPSLNLTRATVSGDILLESVQSDHGASMAGCRVAGGVFCAGMILSTTSPAKQALIMDAAVVQDRLVLKGAQILGTVKLQGARVVRELNVSGTEVVTAPFIDRAFMAQASHIGQAWFTDGFSIEGTIDFQGATVDRFLAFGEGTVRPGTNKLGIYLEDAQVGGQVDFMDGLVAHGVHLSRAEILGMLQVQGCEITGEFGVRFAEIGYVRISHAKMMAPVDLHATRVDRSAILLDTTFTQSVSAESATFGSLLVMDGIRALGGVVLADAQVGGAVVVKRCLFGAPTGVAFDAKRLELDGQFSFSDSTTFGGTVDLTRVKANQELVWRGIAHPDSCELLLGHASVRGLTDDAESWPRRIELEGFEYDHISEDSPQDLSLRVDDWMSRSDSRVSSQPYEALAAALAASTGDSARKRVLYELHRQRMREAGGGGKVLRWIVLYTIGHGLYPFWALWWMGGFIAVGSIVFGLQHLRGGMIVRDQSGQCPPFNALFYSVDVFVPLVDLEQAKHRVPRRLWWLWVQRIVGWGTTTLLVVGYTGLVG